MVGWLDVWKQSLLFLFKWYNGSKFITYKTGLYYVMVIISLRGIAVSMCTLYTIRVGDKGYLMVTFFNQLDTQILL